MLLCLVAAIGSTYLGAQFIPPGYPKVPAEDVGRDGIDVWVSDPDVRVDLTVQILDYGGTSAPAPRLLLWMESATNKTVQWWMILSGSARFVDPLGSRQTGSFADFVMDGGTMRVTGPYQVAEGTATVGPSAVTARVADISGEAVGPYFFTTGAWPSYGSKTILTLPAYSSGGYPNTLEFHNLVDSLEPMKSFHVGVVVEVSTLPGFVRIDHASPPVNGDSIFELAWDADGGLPPIKAAYTDLQKEADESSRGLLAGAFLGIAGGLWILGATILGRLLLGLWQNRGRTPN